MSEQVVWASPVWTANDLKAATDEQVDRWTVEARIIDADNSRRAEFEHRTFSDMMAPLLRRIPPQRYEDVRSLLTQCAPSQKPPRLYTPEMEKEQQVRRLRREAAAVNAMHARAVIHLHKLGLAPGVDYDPVKAIETADNRAFDDEVAKRSQQPGSYEFLGGDQCDSGDCRWDGIDRRCNCGNRRVAEAY